MDVDGRCCSAAAGFLLCESSSSSSFPSAALLPPPAPTGTTLFGPSEERVIVVYCMRMVWSCFDGRRMKGGGKGCRTCLCKDGILGGRRVGFSKANTSCAGRPFPHWAGRCKVGIVHSGVLYGASRERGGCSDTFSQSGFLSLCSRHGVRHDYDVNDWLWLLPANPVSLLFASDRGRWS